VVDEGSTALSEQVAYWKGQNRLTYEAQSQRAEQAEAALKQATERVNQQAQLISKLNDLVDGAQGALDEMGLSATANEFRRLTALTRQDEKPKCAHAGCELVLAFVGRNATPSKFCPEHAAPTAQAICPVCSQPEYRDEHGMAQSLTRAEVVSELERNGYTSRKTCPRCGGWNVTSNARKVRSKCVF
jgi:hypothetical protein